MVARPALYPQVTFDTLQAQAQRRHLTILGGFHPSEDDQAPKGCKTLLLLGPDDPGFWPEFKTSTEWQDGAADPMDRWSTRVIGAWATDIGATALYPFGGAPFLPFFTWAKRTGRVHASPIMLLVHDTAGLMVSFRGALALTQHIDLQTPPANPCDTCDAKPCRTACPVGALDGTGYDVPLCKSYLASDDGDSCMTAGCISRRACPVSQAYPRDAEQSAYHMKKFKG